MKKVLVFIILSLFIISPVSHAEEKKPSFESIIYSGFKTIKSFASIGVYLKGSAEKIELNKEDLTNFLRLRFKNNFAEIKFEETDFDTIWKKDDTKKAEHGNISINVWTVGDDYPIAFHIEITAGNYKNFNVYDTAILGYDSKRNIGATVKQSISELVDDLAVSFFTAREEL